MAQINDMTVGSPSRGILKFAIPIILGYILQQMYQVIDAVIVGRWVGVNGLAAVGASTSVMFIIMGFVMALVPALPFLWHRLSVRKTSGRCAAMWPMRYV